LRFYAGSLLALLIRTSLLLGFADNYTKKKAIIFLYLFK